MDFNIWQPQGSHFTAKFGIGTPPLTKSAYDPLRSRRGPRPNRCSAHIGMHVEKEYISIFFGLNSSSNTIKQLDATFGSRRGAVLQQIVESAHRLKLKVSLTCYKLGVGTDPIDGVHTLAGTWRKNQFFFFFFPMTWSSNTIKRLDATFGSRRGAISQQNPESAHPLKGNVSLTCPQFGVGLVPLYGVYTLGGMWQRNKFPILSARICLQIL